jgi:PAS domain S-box-containing protein
LTGQIVRANQRFADIVGRTRPEVEQLNVAGLTHPQDVVRDRELMGQLKAGLVREYAREKRYVRKDGSDVWVSLTVSAMWAPGEAPGLCIGIVQDITERKRLDEHFLQAQKMEALGQFSGGVAHDFNNILATISGYTELSRMLLQGNSEVRAHLDAVLKASGRAADLVNQILTFSRQQPQERQTIQLQRVVAESVKLLRATIPSTIAFDVSIAADAPAVFGNANQIHQVLTNLGVNAWHAMQDGPGRLQITLEKWRVDDAHAVAQPRLRPGRYARVSVSDTGCGMDAATVRRIFEPFFTTKPVGQGTGLGLAVVHGIMDAHDGAVTVYSQPGEGTVFHLYFPAHAGEPAAEAAAEGAIPRGRGEAVLVVDDEETIASMIQQTLIRLDYAAEFASDSAAALALVQANPAHFKLVLSDQTMPGMTGLGLATRLREIRPDLPVLLMTGFSASLTPARLEAAGVRQVLFKPLTVQTLAVALHAVLSAPPP